MPEKLLQIAREKNLCKVEVLNQIIQTVNLTKTVSLNSMYTHPLKSHNLR